MIRCRYMLCSPFLRSFCVDNRMLLVYADGRYSFSSMYLVNICVFGDKDSFFVGV